MASRILRFLVLVLFGSTGLAIFRRIRGQRRENRGPARVPRAGATPSAAAARPTVEARRTSGRRGPKLPVRRVLWITGILLLAGSVTFALFTKTTTNTGNTYASAADFRAPTVDRSVIQPNGGNNASAGWVKQGQSYFVYANVTDTGNPASGISSVTANVCNVTSTSCSSVAMTAGSYTANSVTYNYRSAAQTASNPLSEGTKSYSITAADTASNSGNASFNVTVDNTAPTVTRQIACGGSGCSSTGYVGAAKTYFVYAQVSDGASGVNTVTTDPRTITATASATTAMTTSGGPWTIGGNTYNYRTAQLTADAGIVDASIKAYTVTPSDNLGNTTSPSANATVDNVAPVKDNFLLNKTLAGRLSGAIGASDGYLIYADLSDAASGVDTSTATTDVSTLTTGETSVPMCYSASGYAVNTFGGTGTTTYDYKSDNDGSPCDGTFTSLTTDAGLTEVSKTFTITFKDNAGNSTTGNNSLTIDNTSDTVSNFEINNTSGGTTGRLEQNDKISFGMNTSVDPEGVLSGWFGDTGNVVVRLIDGGGTCVASSDQLQVYNAANSAPTNLGTVCLGGTGYNTSGSTITFGATGTPSNMAMGCLTACTDVTLGTQSAAAAIQAGNTTAVWTPGSFYDAAGNNLQTTPVSKTVDNTAPTISAARICGGTTCSADWVGQGKTYFIYANATDANAGIDANTGVKADVSNITTGATSVALTTCSSGCVVNGITYAYKSAQQTASNPISGTKAWTLSVTDKDSNKATSTPTATVDNTAPSVASSVISKTPGYLASNVKQGGSYFVYANVSDANSGLDTVTANVNNVTTGQTAVALTAGSFSTQGVSYNYRSAALTSSNPLTAGAKTYTITATDNAVNSASPSFNVTVDNTALDASDVQCTNVGTAGLPNNGDICNFTHNDNVDPFSVNPIASWTGTSTTVAVRFLNDGTGSVPAACDTGTNDTMVIYNAANSAQITALGCVNLGLTNYVTANLTCTASTLIQPTVPGTVNRVTLGGCPTFTAGTGTSTLGYYPSTSLYGDAGNNLTDTTVQNETGTADRDF